MASDIQLIKIVTVGDLGVGKTFMLFQHFTHQIPRKYSPTVFDSYTGIVETNGKSYNIQPWDTANSTEHNNYDGLRPLAYPRTDVFLVCYAVNNPCSLSNVAKYWLPELERHVPRDIPIILVGTKSDLRLGPDLSKCIPVDVGYQVAKENDMYYAEASAVTRDGLKDLFDKAMELAINPATCRKRNKKYKLKNNANQGRFVRPMMPTTVKALWIEIKTSIYSQQMTNALTDSDSADVVFLIEGAKRVTGHKVVLCSASNFFCEVFGIVGPVEDPEDIKLSFTHQDISDGKVAGLSSIVDNVDIDGRDVTQITISEDISLCTFSLVLEFLYTGFPKFQEGIDSVILKDVSRLAHLFSLPYLSKIINNIENDEDDLNPSIVTYAMETMCQRAKAMFLGKDTFSDVTFHIEDSIVPAHKVLLMNRCDVMSRMFCGQFTESAKGEATIKGDSKESFLALLEYFYTDQYTVQGVDHLGILTISEKYDIDRLKNLCELYLTKELDKAFRVNGQITEDIVRLLHQAQCHSAKQLANWCLHFICSNYLVYKEREEFCQLEGENLEYVTKNRWPPASYLVHLEEYNEKTIRVSKTEKKACRVM